MTEERLKEIFGQYGSVVSTKVLPVPWDLNKPHAKATGFVRMGSAEEAKNIIELLNNQIPMGLTSPLTIKYVGDGVPLLTNVCKKLETGEKMYFGTVQSIDVSRRSAYIYCEELFWGYGEIYSHLSVLDR